MATFELNDWRIDAVSRPISNAHELDALRDHVRIPLPEMTYGNNLLQLTHTPSNWQYSFSARDALAMVKRGDLGAGDGAAKVGYADEWLSTRFLVHPLSSIGSLTTI
jgi:type 2A phosphatase activator TIP41